MDLDEFRYQTLARIIKTENQQMISEYTRAFTTADLPRMILVDKCNLPLLMVQHAPENPDVQNFLAEMDERKTEIYNKQKRMILERFKNGLIRKTAGGNIIFERFIVLVQMLTMEDPDYVRLAYQLFNELNFDVLHYLTVLETARQARHLYPEADAVIQKIERIFRGLGQPPENQPQENQPHEGDLAENAEPNNDDAASIASEDSGFGDESEDVLEEDARLRRLADCAFEKAFVEVLLKNLSESLRSQNVEKIRLALEARSYYMYQIPLFMYRKHEICRQIHESKCLLANDLFKEIEEMGEREFRYDKHLHEVFTKIVNMIKVTVTNEMMEVLMTYWRQGEKEYYVHAVVQTLLAKKFSLEQVERFNIMMRLQTTRWETPAFPELFRKVTLLQFESLRAIRDDNNNK